MTTAVSQISTYTDLQNAIADYLVRDDLTARIPLFIQLFESMANRTIRNRQMQVRFTATTSGGEAYYAIPADWLQTANFVVEADQRYRMNFLTPEQQDDIYPCTSTSGIPETFTIWGQEFRLAPIPDGEYTIELFYFQKIPALKSADGGTNWLLTNHPDIYLFGALLQTAPFQKDDDRIAEWQAIYTGLLADLKIDEDAEQWNNSPLQTTSYQRYCP